MMNIGIIGSESSHAMQFAKYFNLPDPQTGKIRHSNIRVTSIMGDAESAKKTAEDAHVENIAETVDELLVTVDAVMITSRRGSQHMEQALPFIQKQVPIFIDKPFTSNLPQAQEFAELLHKAACPVLGGSGCKYCASVHRIKTTVQKLLVEDSLLTASLNFAIMMDSPYDGFYFYAPHLVEICLEIFGAEIQAIQAIRTEKSLVANLQYTNFIVSLHFVTNVWENTCTLLTTSGPQVMTLDISDCLTEEAERFAQLLHQEIQSTSYDELVRPIMLIDAILRAESNGKTIPYPL